MGPLDVLCKVFPAVAELRKSKNILAVSLQNSWDDTQELRNRLNDKDDLLAAKELEIARLKIQVEAKREPPKERIIHAKTSGDVRRLMERRIGENVFELDKVNDPLPQETV